MPNALAYLMLLIWPLVCVMLFRRLPFERALIWCVLGAYLILPPVAEFDLPLVPDMDKYSIPALSIVVVGVWMMGKPFPRAPRSLLVRSLIFLFVLSAIPTVLTNRDPINFSVLADTEPISFVTGQLPGLRIRDLGSVIINQIIIIAPFFMAYRYLATEKGMRELLLALAIGGLVYTLPGLVEIRLSPQTNVWIYGFFQHDFGQMVRNGGFRPLVFLPHALLYAFFLMTSILAAGALARANLHGEDRIRFGVAVVFMLGVLYLCKSLASQLYALAFLPLVLFIPFRWQMRIVIMLATIAIVYPMLRNLGLVPLDTILDRAYAFDANRGHSLEFRFNNEERLLERAHEKNWFGWGGWGRNLIMHRETGQILSIPDGQWIIVFGTFGWVGYLAQMGLLAAPLALLMRGTSKLKEAEVSPYVAPLAIILIATMADMLVNASLTPFTWLCAGAILGYAESLSEADASPLKRRLFPDGPVMGGRQGKVRPRSLL